LSLNNNADFTDILFSDFGVCSSNMKGLYKRNAASPP